MLSPRSRLLSALALAAALSPRAASSQGLIIDRRPGIPIARAFEITTVDIDARVRDQIAEVRVSQTFHNPGSTVIEAEYLFPLPEDGAIQNFVLLVDGKELPGRLLPRDEARRIYEEIVRSKRDPALLEYVGKGVFRTGVFPIPPGADRKISLRYTQLCKRERDVIEFQYPLATQRFSAKPIRDLRLAVSIQSTGAIKSIYSPIHDYALRRIGEREAEVRLDQHNVVPDKDFRLLYTLGEGAVGATVLSYRPSEGEDGYFLLLAAPEVKPPDAAKPAPKTVVFILDRSGSMAGKKIEQAKEALRFVLNNLKDDDLFNIVVYDDRVETFKPELQRFDSRSRDEAERYVSNIREGGSTNISEALRTALGLIRDDSRPNYVLFLTDGLPTSGETGEMRIAEIARSSNKHRSRVFAFGVGFDVNARLLDRISGGNSGTSEYVRPDESIESHVAAFYGKLTRPVLAGLSIEVAGSDVNRTYPRDIPDLFEGGQIVWAGRYSRSGRATVRMTGKVGDERRVFEFPVELASSGSGNSFDFVEKLWAIRRVGFIIDQIDLHGKNKELTDELVSLSTKYGILTYYTSFLADERVQLHAATANSVRAERVLRDLEQLSGGYGVMQRGAKQGYGLNDKADVARVNRLAEAVPGAVPATLGRMAAPSANQTLGGYPGGPTSGGRMAGIMPGMGLAGGGGREAGQAEPVKQVGNKTFFRRASGWIDSEVKPEQEKIASRIEQFSDEYFKLSREQSPELNQYLTFTEVVTVNLNGRVYRIEPPKAR